MAGAYGLDYTAVFAIFNQWDVKLIPAYLRYIKKLEDYSIEYFRQHKKVR